MSKKIFSALPAKRKQELCETLETHPNIEEVHFTKEGEHYFNVYEHSGKKFGHIIVNKVRDTKKNVTVTTKVPNLKTIISETSSRDEIMGAGSGDGGEKELKGLKSDLAKLEKSLDKEKDEFKRVEIEGQISDIKAKIAEIE